MAASRHPQHSELIVPRPLRAGGATMVTLVAPDQALAYTEALHAYTTSGTWLTREETLKGTLTPGKVAGICVIDRDYFTVPDAEIKDIQVVMTMIDGRVVYTATA
ncbi:MAG: amidohydrolase family protein [Caldilineaceae bacterium]